MTKSKKKILNLLIGSRGMTCHRAMACAKPLQSISYPDLWSTERSGCEIIFSKKIFLLNK